MWTEIFSIPRENSAGHLHKSQQLANIACKGQDGKYFRLCGPHGLSQLLNSATFQLNFQFTKIGGSQTWPEGHSLLTPDINNHSFKLISLIEKKIEGKIDVMRKKYEFGTNKHLIEYDKYFLSTYYILGVVLGVGVKKNGPNMNSALKKLTLNHTT